MANPWFRLYSEFAHDPKIQRMGEALQRRFIMLLCLRCSNGHVTLHDEDVTFLLRISNEEWAETKAVFVEKNLIDADNNPVAWDRRQFASDSSAERVARHRESKKRLCNVTVTAPDTEQIQNRTEEKNIPASLREVPPSDSAKQKSVTLSQWIQSLAGTGEKLISGYAPLWDYCAKVGIPEDWVEIAWIQFRERYTTDEKAKRKRYVNWRRTFQNAVEGNWFKLWYFSERDNQFRLSTVGIAADLATKEAA